MNTEVLPPSYRINEPTSSLLTPCLIREPWLSTAAQYKLASHLSRKTRNTVVHNHAYLYALPIATSANRASGIKSYSSVVIRVH